MPAHQHNTEDARHYLLFSLMIHLNVSVLDFLRFLFSSDRKDVKSRARGFTGYHQSREFPPCTIWNLWTTNFKTCRQHLEREIVIPAALDIGRTEFRRVQHVDELKVNVDKLTTKTIHELLDPTRLSELYRTHLPFTFNFLTHLETTDNDYRQRKRREHRDPVSTASRTLGGGEMEDGESEDEEEVEANIDSDPHRSQADLDEDLSDEQVSTCERGHLTVLTAIGALVYAFNRASNLQPLMLGILAMIEGSSVRLFGCLNRSGLAVSRRTVDRVREVISDDSLKEAVTLANDPLRPSVLMFDNINIYLAKHHAQRIDNQNSMIHATNAVIIQLPPSVQPETLARQPWLDLQGQRHNFDLSEMRITPDDDAFMARCFDAVIAKLIFDYCPGHELWKGRKGMGSVIDASFPEDRPIEVRKTQTGLLGALDVNEGSKEGCINVLSKVRELLGKDEEEMASSMLPVAGDFLTSRNLRSARVQRKDDIPPFHTLEYVHPISQLFHFEINATKMLIDTHAINVISDAGSLSRQKDVLHRKFDIKNPPHHDAKALVHQSLVARVLNMIMVVKGFEYWSELAKWQPGDAAEVQALATDIRRRFLRTWEAESCLGPRGDHVYAHAILFLRDSLILKVFQEAVRNGDPGIVLRVLKYWLYSFRGSGSHNYARECFEILTQWKSGELTDEMKLALEKTWFYNRWGLPRRFVASDHYIEDLNYWIKQVFIPEGSGVTINNIMAKTSRCIESFRGVIDSAVKFYGGKISHRKHKEKRFYNDLRVLTELMHTEKVYFKTPDREDRCIWKQGATEPITAVYDLLAEGYEGWNEGKSNEYIAASMYHSSHRFPIAKGMADVTESQNMEVDIGN